MTEQLKIVDFSKGIKSQEIQHNFEVIEDQIARERLSIAGHGVSSGLELLINDFKLTITKGALIDIDGKEKFITEKNVTISLPFLTKVEEMRTVTQDGQIFLSHIPYAPLSLNAQTGRTTSENTFKTIDKTKTGITILDFNNLSNSIAINNISGNVLYVDANKYRNADVIIKYSYSYKRLDTVYIDNQDRIKIAEGLTSTSPSINIPKDNKYTLGFLEINALFPNDNGIPNAKLILKKDIKSLRNIYTDKDNELFINGVSFKDLQIIHMIEPTNPNENTLWYDGISNKLRVWKRDTHEFSKIYTYTGNKVNNKTIFNTDISYKVGHEELRIYVNNYELQPGEFTEGVDLSLYENNTGKSSNRFEILISLSVLDKVKYVIHKPSGYSGWVGVNDTSFIHVQEIKMWLPHENPLDKQTFLFTDEEVKMHYIPGKNELSVIIDNSPLMSDQFEEITIEDINGEYENKGIGFKLTNPLDKWAHVEARVTHRVNDNPVRKRFQRSATFIATDSFEYIEANGTKQFATKVPYRYDDEQLEVYIEGRRLDLGIDFLEGVDLDTAEKVKGANSRMFEIVANIADRSRVSYKITSSVYSYDHVSKILEDLEDRIIVAEQKANESNIIVTNLVTQTSEQINSLQEQINVVEEQNLDHVSFIKKTDVLIDTNMPNYVNLWIPKGFINFTVIKQGGVALVGGPGFQAIYNEIKGIAPKDFITVFDMNNSGGNSILRRDSDYIIELDEMSGNIYMSFTNPASIPDGHHLYVTGIRFDS